MNFVEKMMKFCIKMLDFVFKMLDLVFKMMSIYLNDTWYKAVPSAVSKFIIFNTEFIIFNTTFITPAKRERQQPASRVSAAMVCD